MNNHFLHGSVKEIYRTLVNDIPHSWSQLIPAGVEALLAYGSHGDPDHYSLVPLTTKEGTKLLFSRCSRKRNAKSPSYYVHKQLMDVDMNTLYSGFDQLLQTPFCSEEEFDRFANDPVGQMQPDIRWTGGEVKIAPAILHGILHAMISRWRNGSDPVIIRVPNMSAEDYNRYTFGAVRTIYSCLPAGIRGKVGFMTYSSPVKQLNSVGLFFLPESQTSRGVYLDQEENEQSRQLLNGYLDENMEKLIHSIAHDPIHRQDRLRDLWELTEAEVPLQTLLEFHYTSCLKYARILDLKIGDPTQRREILDLFVNHENIPEPLGSKLLGKLSAQIMPSDLDTYILNRQEGDRDFREYLTRIQEWERLCICSDNLKLHTSRRVREVFADYLSGITEETPLCKLEAQLTELAGNPPTIFPADQIDYCSKKWADHAEPIYTRKINQTLEEIETQMDGILNSKAPKDAALKQILANAPKDVNTKLIQVQTSLYAEIKKLPKRFTEAKADFQLEFGDRLKELTEKKAKALADQYLLAAERDLQTAMASVDAKLQKRIGTLRADLEKLTNELYSYETVSPKDMMAQFDQAVTEQQTMLREDLTKKACRDLHELSPDGPIASIYDAVAGFKHDLKQQLQYLDTDNAAEWSKPFCDEADSNFYDLLKSRCRKKEIDKDNEYARKDEIQRLEELSTFLAKYYPKDTNLKENVAGQLKTLRNAKSGKLKPKSSYSSKYKGTSGITPPAEGSKKTAHHAEASSAQNPQVNDDEEISILQDMEKSPQIIDVCGKTLVQILAELCDASQSSKNITLTDSMAAMSFVTTNTRTELRMVLEWLRAPNGKSVPEGFNIVNLSDLLQEHFAVAALTPREKVSILAALTKDQAFCSLGQRWVEQQIRHLQDWNGDKNNQREIQRLLRNHPEYAAACPEWLQKSGLAKIKDFFSQAREGRTDTDQRQAEGNRPDDVQKKSDHEIFWTGFCAGAIVASIAAVIIWWCFLRPAPEITPPETTAPTTQTEAVNTDGETDVNAVGENENADADADNEGETDTNADGEDGNTSDSDGDAAPSGDTENSGDSDNAGEDNAPADGEEGNASDGDSNAGPSEDTENDADSDSEDASDAPADGGLSPDIPPTPVGGR